MEFLHFAHLFRSQLRRRQLLTYDAIAQCARNTMTMLTDVTHF